GAGKKHGGWIPSAGPLVQVEGRTYGLPMFYILLPMLWRKDLFDANNLKAPDTWELARVAARTLKAKGHPTGIQFSQCADANLNWRSLLFSFGGAELDTSGENILVDSKETREALKFANALFDEGMTPEVCAWDDASDNRYLASGVACWIHDAISAYRTTEDTNPDVFKNTHIGMEPAGPGGKRVSVSSANVYMVWKFAKNQQAAREFLTYFLDEGPEGMKQSRGYNMPYLLGQAKKPMPIIGTDPKMQILQDFPKIVAFYGYPGPFTTPIQEVVNLYVLPDMFTRVARGQSVDDVMKWGWGSTAGSSPSTSEHDRKSAPRRLGPCGPGRRCVCARPQRRATVAESQRTPADVRLHPAGAGGALRGAPCRRAVSLLALPRGERRQCRRPGRSLHRPRELPRRLGDGPLLARLPQQRGVPRGGGRAQEPARHVAGLPAPAELQGQEADPRPRGDSLHAADRDQRAVLEVDVRLAVQRHQLGAEPPRPDRAIRNGGLADLARRSQARA